MKKFYLMVAVVVTVAAWSGTAQAQCSNGTCSTGSCGTNAGFGGLHLSLNIGRVLPPYGFAQPCQPCAVAPAAYYTSSCERPKCGLFHGGLFHRNRAACPTACVQQACSPCGASVSNNTVIVQPQQPQETKVAPPLIPQPMQPAEEALPPKKIAPPKPRQTSQTISIRGELYGQLSDGSYANITDGTFARYQK